MTAAQKTKLDKAIKQMYILKTRKVHAAITLTLE